MYIYIIKSGYHQIYLRRRLQQGLHHRPHHFLHRKSSNNTATFVHHLTLLHGKPIY